jgi:hypothetical protein
MDSVSLQQLSEMTQGKVTRAQLKKSIILGDSASLQLFGEREGLLPGASVSLQQPRGKYRGTLPRASVSLELKERIKEEESTSESTQAAEVGLGESSQGFHRDHS